MENSRIQRVAYFLVIVVFGIILLREGAFLIVPLVWGVFFAFALNPIANWFELKRIPRGIAILISILLVTLVAVGIFYLLVNQVIGLLDEIPQIQNTLENKLKESILELNDLIGAGSATIDFESLSISSLLNIENINTTIFQTGKSLTLAGIIPLYTFLLIYYKDFFAEFILKLYSDRNDKVLTWAADSGKVIQSYLSGMLKVTFIVSILAGLFFFLIGVEYFILFAAFIAIMNLIPYVGVFISSFFAVLYIFLTTDSITYPIIAIAVLWGIQLLENNIITPLEVGSQVKVNALAVLLAILIGGWLWGISGMILFIPLIGVLKISLEKSADMSAFAYLLGDDVPVSEKNENYWKAFRRKISKKKSNP
jgi:predicted PurR-regulated permease PerM